MTSLARWRAIYIEKKNIKEKRPPHTSMCDDLSQAIVFRKDIIHEIATKVGKIQNQTLGEHIIRDLNDDINKLLKEKYHWDKRIVELGGPNVKFAFDMVKADGKEVFGSKGYRYFGAAKNLPGVRELFNEPPPSIPKKLRSTLQKSVNTEYFGFETDNEQPIDSKELEEEINILMKNKDKHSMGRDEEKIRRFVLNRAKDYEYEPIIKVIDIPDQNDVQNYFLDQQKKLLLQDVDENFQSAN
ncbi:MAG: NineTeen Complex (NTC) component [Marteilia pararefringens]